MNTKEYVEDALRMVGLKFNQCHGGDGTFCSSGSGSGGSSSVSSMSDSEKGILAKDLANGKTTLAHGQWQQETSHEYSKTRRTYKAQDMELSFNSSTDYGKEGRLRDPAKTKYSTEVIITTQRAGRTTLDYLNIPVGKSFRGEHKREDFNLHKTKVEQWASKAFGIEHVEWNS